MHQNYPLALMKITSNRAGRDYFVAVTESMWLLWGLFSTYWKAD